MTKFQYRIRERIDEIIWQRDDCPEHIECVVKRNDQVSGRLIVRNKDTDETIIEIESWMLTYGAQFGPDQDQVKDWIDFTTPFVEAAKNGSKIDKATMEEYLRFGPQAPD